MDDTNDRGSADNKSGPPKEGSNLGHLGEGNSRANISHTITTEAHTASTEGRDPGEQNAELTPAEENVPDDDEIDGEGVALEDGSGDDAGATKGAADEQDTLFKRSI